MWYPNLSTRSKAERRRYWQIRKERLLIYGRRSYIKGRNNLLDYHIRAQLKAQGVLQPTPEQIDAKRQRLLLHRLRPFIDLSKTMTTLTNAVEEAAPTILTEIEVFAKLVREGIDAWTKAGELLVACLDKDREFLAKVRKAHPEISYQMLLVFERIGRRQIYAPLLADNSLGAKALLETPYEVQERYSREPIPVVESLMRGKIVGRHVSELTRTDVKLVFDKERLLTPKEQIAKLREARNRTRPSAGVVIEKREPSKAKITKLGYFKVTSRKDGLFLEPTKDTPDAQVVNLTLDKSGYYTGVIVVSKEEPPQFDYR